MPTSLSATQVVTGRCSEETAGRQASVQREAEAWGAEGAGAAIGGNNFQVGGFVGCKPPRLARTPSPPWLHPGTRIPSAAGRRGACAPVSPWASPSAAEQVQPSVPECRATERRAVAFACYPRPRIPSAILCENHPTFSQAPISARKKERPN